MSDKAKEAWRSAQSFAELRALTTQWVAGDLAFNPSYYGDAPDPEINEIVEPLVRLNQRGLLTVISQPGALDDGHAQRAWVEGFAQEDTARRIAAKALYSDLHILAFPPGVERGYMTPITVRDGHPITWAGASSRHELEVFAEVCSPEALRQLEAAWYVIAIDLVWGRQAHLWDVLLADDRPGFSVVPHPDLGVDYDFYY